MNRFGEVKDDSKIFERGWMMRLVSMLIILITFIPVCVLAESPPGLLKPIISEENLTSELQASLDLGNYNVEQTAVTIAKDYPGEYNLNQVSEVYDTLRKGWYYISDPSYKEKYKNANRTLQDGKISNSIGMGNCHDFAILMASLLESLQGSTRIIFAYSQDTRINHAYAEVYLGKKDDPRVNELIIWLKDQYNQTEVPGLEVDGGEVWLNLDYNSTYPGGRYFDEGHRVERDVVWQSTSRNTPKIVPIIDTMDSTAGWETIGDENGSTVSISSVPSPKGRAIQMDFDLKDGGWVEISRNVSGSILSQARGLNLSYYGPSKVINIQLILDYEDGTRFGYSWKLEPGNKWAGLEALFEDFTKLEPSISSDLIGQRLDSKKVNELEIKCLINGKDTPGAGRIIIDHIRGAMNIPAGSPWERAERTRQDALSRTLVAQAEILRESQVDKLPLSVQLSIEALRLANSSRLLADQSLRNGLDLLPRSIALIPLQDNIKAMDFSPDGKYLATASGDTAKIWAVNGGRLLVCLSHNSTVTNLAFSPNGKYLATASYDRTARIWETASGKELVRIDHEAPVICAVFSPDGNTLATTSYGSEDIFSKEKNSMVKERYGGGIRLWNATTGKRVSELDKNSEVEDIAFTHDGKYLVTRDLNKTLRLWELTGDHRTALISKEADIFILSSDGNYMAVAENEDFGRDLKIYDIHNGKEMSNYSMENYPIQFMTFSPNAKYLAAVDNFVGMLGTEYAPRLWKIKDGKTIELLPYCQATRFSQKDPIHRLAFSPDEKLLATSSDDHTTRIWDIEECKEVARISNEGDTSKITFSPDGMYLAIASGKTASIWGTSGYHETALIMGDPMAHIALSPDGKYIATNGGYLTKGFSSADVNIAYADESVRIWEVSNQHELACLPPNTTMNVVLFDNAGRLPQENALNALTFSNDGQYLATASSNDTSTIWEIKSGKRILSVSHNGSVNSVAFSPDGKKLATASSDKTSRLWDVASGKELLSLAHKSAVNAVSFSSDGAYLATGDAGGNVWVWDTKDYKGVAHFVHNDSVLYIAFSPNGKYLAAICGSDPRSFLEDHIAYIWDVNSRRIIRNITNEKGVQDIAFSPDGRYLAIACGDGTLHIEDESSGQDVAQLSQEACIYSLAFSSDGKYLATGSGDRTTRVWLWRPEDLIAEACSRLGRNMTLDEWKQYLGDEPYCQICDANYGKLN